MKRCSKSEKRSTRQRRPPTTRLRERRQDQVTELLKICLQKVCELQEDLRRTDEEENDPEAAGYAACAVETLRFLSAEGLPPNHPIVKTLTERLLEGRQNE